MQSWPLPDRLQCWVQQRSDDGHADPSQITADLWIEAEGQPVGWIDGLRLRRLPRPMLDLLFPLPPVAPGPDLLETGWEQLESLPAPPAGSVPEVSTEAGEQILELEGF